MPSATFAVETFVQGTVATVKPVGWLTDERQADVAGQFEALHRHGYSRFVVDLSALHVLDHSGLGVLLTFQRRAAAAGGCLLVASPSGSSLRALVAGRLARQLRICDTVAEAVDLAKEMTSSGQWKAVRV